MYSFYGKTMLRELDSTIDAILQCVQYAHNPCCHCLASRVAQGHDGLMDVITVVTVRGAVEASRTNALQWLWTISPYMSSNRAGEGLARDCIHKIMYFRKGGQMTPIRPSLRALSCRYRLLGKCYPAHSEAQ